MLISQYSIINSASRSAAASALLLIGGCDDPAPEPTAHVVEAPAAGAFSATGREWIDIDDKVSPALWLASREAGKDVDPADPAVQSLATLLHEADLRFTEGPRMVANRSVQVQSMLAERGVRETPRAVIAGLVSIAEVGERFGFGETCQHYVNARAAGPDQASALAALRRQPLPKAVEGAAERP